MANRIKAVFGFNLAGIGGSEHYFTTTGDYTQLRSDIQLLIYARNQLLFENILWSGVRLSNATLKRRSVFYPPGTYTPWPGAGELFIPPTGNRTELQSPTYRPDQARATLQIRVRFDDDRRVIRYLYGVPDLLLQHEPGGVNQGAVTGWATEFNNFVAVLVQRGFCIRALERARIEPGNPDPNVFNVVQWVSSAGPPASIGFVLASAPPPNIEAGSFVRVSNVRRRGTDRLSYNGRYFVQSVVPNPSSGTTTYFLRGTEDGEVDSIKLPGQVAKLKYTFYPILGIEPVRVGIHKRGNVLGTPHGRRQNRVSLDP